MEEEYEISRTIVDELIPYSLEYYLGINPENDDYEDEEDCDDDEDGDDKDSDEDGDEEKDKKDKKKS
jgi:nucleosome assembly protein 1-like 1